MLLDRQVDPCNARHVSLSDILTGFPPEQKAAIRAALPNFLDTMRLWRSELLIITGFFRYRKL
jgi:hypothetical protein